jgi:heavy metal sensor kinase
MMTLKTRLAVWSSLVWILFVLSFTAVLYFAVKRSVRAEMIESLEAEALEVSRTFILHEDSVKIIEVHQWLELEHQMNSDYAVFLQVVDDSGHVLKRSDNLLVTGDVLPVPSATSKTGDAVVEITKKGTPFFLYNYPMMDGSGRLIGWTQVAAFETRVTTFLRVLREWLLIGLLVALLPSVLIGWLIVHKALAPIDQIAGIAASITSEKLSTRIPAPKAKSQEVFQLVAALNALLVRLENAFTRVSQFTNDAAHELLTPLTSLHSDIEITLRRQRQPADYIDALRRLKLDTERMENIIRNLLFLAHADNGSLAVSFETVDPSRIVQEVIDDLAPLIYSKSISVSFAPTPAQLPGNEVLLQQLFANLIKNAALYTPAEGKIEIACGVEERVWFCQIADTGVGIPKDMHENVFERFFRADASRQRESGGAGLGLAIARQIAREHGGDVQLMWSESGKGTSFKVLLPVEKPGAAGEQD